MNEPILSVSGLSVGYPAAKGLLRALDDVSLEVGGGRALGVVGESGSGKSTLALAIMGLLAPEARIESGVAMFRQHSLFALSDTDRRKLRGNRISIVFQDPFGSLNPAIPVGEQIAEPLILHQRRDRSEAIEMVHGLLAEVGIADPVAVALAYPHQLSGGMKQRALIATALACEPDLLVLDEPTTALDVTIEAQILDLLERLRRDRGLSMLYITHNLGVVARICDDVCVLYAGRVLEQSDALSLLRKPRHPYTRGLLASLPRVGERKRRLSPIPGRFPDMSAPPSGCIFHPRCEFALDRCKVEAQVLIGGVRCWRAGVGTDSELVNAVSVALTNEPSGTAADVSNESFQDAAREREPSTPGAKSLVSVHGLSKTFELGGLFDGMRIDFSGGFPLKFEAMRVLAVDDVSLNVARGEVLGLVGESGCGKSTLGRMLVGLIQPSAGEIVVEGGTPKENRRSAQIIFQNPDSSLNPRKTIESIVGRPLVLYGLARGAGVRERVVDLLEMVRLSAAYLSRYPHQLSGGEKQRVGIARALATSPKFIVCDEAVSALDVSVQAYVLNVLADLRDRLNVAYLFISHDLSVIAHIADRVAVMYRGAIVESGWTSDVLRPPWHPYTEALLSAIPDPEQSSSGQRIRLLGDAVEQGPVRRGCRFQHRCPRKIGAVCETEAPPVVQVSARHSIACHLAVDLRDGG